MKDRKTTPEEWKKKRQSINSGEIFGVFAGVALGLCVGVPLLIALILNLLVGH